jgi:hypothetical protein
LVPDCTLPFASIAKHHPIDDNCPARGEADEDLRVLSCFPFGLIIQKGANVPFEDEAGVISAWYGHVPFAHWVVGALKPRMLVELGTHYGVSYSAFCEPVVRNGLDTRCFAVDTWKGDDQSGHYGEEVYLDFRRFHNERYGAFSELLHLRRCAGLYTGWLSRPIAY